MGGGITAQTDDELYLNAETMFHCYYSYLKGNRSQPAVAVDSDEEYRGTDDFLDDKIVFKSEVENKEKILHYFRFF